MTQPQSDMPHVDDDHPTPVTAHVLALTGGWPSILEEEWEWLQEACARAHSFPAPQPTPRNESP